MILDLILIAGAVAAALGIYRVILGMTLTQPSRASEIHTVRTADGWHITLFRYRAATGAGEPVFLCHGVMENQFTFSSPPGHSLIDVLREKGYDCWHIELRGNRSSLPALRHRRSEGRFDDYLLYDIPAALKFIREATGIEKVHWIGHSMGGMLLYAYELMHGAREIASATTLGTPPGFEGAPALRPKLLLAALAFSPSLFDIVLRCLTPTFPLFKLPISIAPINWNNVHPDIGPATFFNLVETPTYDVADKLTRWGMTKIWRVNNTKVDVISGLKTLRVPLFAIFGEVDAFIPVANGRKFYDALPSDDKKLLVLSKKNGHVEDYNHVDLVMARNGREEVYEPIAAWLAAHPIKEATSDAAVEPTKTTADPATT